MLLAGTDDGENEDSDLNLLDITEDMVLHLTRFFVYEFVKARTGTEIRTGGTRPVPGKKCVRLRFVATVQKQHRGCDAKGKAKRKSQYSPISH